MVWRAHYKTWGALEALAPREIEQNLRFQGQYYDAETGLRYNTFRYYDPVVGRFTAQNPIGLAGGENLYKYAPNSVRWIDPWGWAYQGVDFTGSPDIYPVSGEQRSIFSITMQGSRGRDFTEAYKAAAINIAHSKGWITGHSPKRISSSC